MQCAWVRVRRSSSGHAISARMCCSTLMRATAGAGAPPLPPLLSLAAVARRGRGRSPWQRRSGRRRRTASSCLRTQVRCFVNRGIEGCACRQCVRLEMVCFVAPCRSMPRSISLSCRLHRQVRPGDQPIPVPGCACRRGSGCGFLLRCSSTSSRCNSGRTACCYHAQGGCRRGCPCRPCCSCSGGHRGCARRAEQCLRGAGARSRSGKVAAGTETAGGAASSRHRLCVVDPAGDPCLDGSRNAACRCSVSVCGRSCCRRGQGARARRRRRRQAVRRRRTCETGSDSTPGFGTRTPACGLCCGCCGRQSAS